MLKPSEQQNFAKSMPEYCGAISNKQTACGKMEEVLACEEKIDEEFEILKLL